MLNFAFSTKSLKHLSLNDALNNIAKVGIRTVELYGERPHAYPPDFTAAQASSLLTQLSELKLKITTIDAYGTYGAAQSSKHLSWLAEDWVEREQQIRYTLDCARLAAALGIPKVVISAGSPIPETMDRMEAWRLFVANMYRVLSVVERLGVTLLLRPSPGYLIETSDQILAFLKEMEFPSSLKVDFDFAHLACAGEDPVDAFKTLLPYVENIHLSDAFCKESHAHVQVGEGQLDVKQFLTFLKEQNYDGQIVLYVDTEHTSADDVVAHTIEGLKKLGYSVGEENQ